MKSVVQLARIALVAIVAISILSCGGDGGGHEPNHPPSISNLVYSPTTAYQVAGGTAAITGSVDFMDSGGDVVSLRLATSGGEDVTVPTPDLSGVTSGTATGTVVVPVDTVGTFTFEIWLMDSRGSASNRLSGTFQVLPSDTTGNWQKLPVSPPHRLYGIAWSGSMYVAAGANGTVMSSTNLTAWTVQTTGVTHTLRSVATSGTRFVAVGDNAVGEAIILSSADGVSWSTTYRSGGCQGSICDPASQLSKVIWTGSQFVAVGQEAVITTARRIYLLALTSIDGMSWSRRAYRTVDLGESDYPTRRHVTSVAWSGRQYAVLALDAFTWDPTVWVSPDGEQWTPSAPLPNDAVWSIPLADLTWGFGRFVAVGPAGWGGDAPVFTSTDGVSWQVDSTTVDLPAMNAITTGAGEYQAVGDSHRERSPDGLIWNATPMTDCGNGIAWDDSRYVAVGSAICRSQ